MTEPPPTKPLLVTEIEAARLLSISPRTLWGLAKRGEIPSVKVGTSKRYAVADLEAWIAANKKEAAK